MIKHKSTVSAKSPTKTKDAVIGKIAERTKLAQLEMLLLRPEGATLHQLVGALSWQAHSIRGAMSGSLKKKRGLKIEATKEDGQDRVYRIVE